MHITLGLALPALLLLTVSTAHAAPNTKTDNSNCLIVDGQLLGGVSSLGPWDYTDPRNKQYLPRVEGSYFPPHVERLEGDRKQSAMSAAKTLRIYPNHHRALYTLMRYHRNEPVDVASVELFTMDCLFRRANFFAPKDATVYMLQGTYYHWKSDMERSEKHYLHAYKLQPANPQLNYNLGLFYYDKGDYESAAKHARIAYQGGYPLDGLRKKLASVNVSLN